METFFLALLVIIMILALASGFPVAFALPGSAIISIGLAAFFGFLFGWAQLFIIRTSPTAALSLLSADYLGYFFPIDQIQ